MPNNVLTIASHVNTVRPPVNVTSRNRHLFDSISSYRIADANVQVLEGVEAFGRGPLRLRGQCLPDCFVSQSHVDRWYAERQHWRAALERCVQRVEEIKDPTLWITDNWSCGYFHWIGDTLPRLELAAKRFDLSELTLLLPQKFKRHAYFLESLRAFGLKDVRVLNRFDRVVCQRLILPGHAAVSGQFNHQLMESLRSRILGGLADKASKPTSAESRIFISRRNATRRRLTNESDLLPILKRHGFDVILAESLNWDQQMRLAQSASHLVACHGAGLTNMIGMTDGTRVMELRDPDEPTPNCFFLMANALGLDYYVADSTRTNPKKPVHFADVTVDPKAFEEALEYFLHEDANTQQAA